MKIFFITLAFALTACSSPSISDAPDVPGRLTVIGPVETITHHATGTGMLVRGGPDSPEPCGIQATVDPGTPILVRENGTTAGGLIADIEVGDIVEIYVDGAVAESCPVQGGASAVILMR